MKTAFIFHGTEGYPEENWFPWLKDELETRGYEVIVPQFPTPENQTPETWFKVLHPYLGKINSETIIFGHSLGGAFLLHVLQSLEQPIAQSVFVAAPVGVKPIKNWETDKPFLEKPFDWETIRANCGKATVFHTDNDPFMTPKNGEELSKLLGVQLKMIPGAGHLNATAGYTEFPELLR